LYFFVKESEFLREKKMETHMKTRRTLLAMFAGGILLAGTAQVQGSSARDACDAERALSDSLRSTITRALSGATCGPADFENPLIFEFNDLAVDTILGPGYANPYEDDGVEFMGMVGSYDYECIVGNHLMTGYMNAPREPFVARVRILDARGACRVGACVWGQCFTGASMKGFDDNGVEIVSTIRDDCPGPVFMCVESTNKPIRSVEWRGLPGSDFESFPRVDHVMVDLCDVSDNVRKYCSINVPKMIPDPGTVESTIIIDDSGTIRDLNVQVDITHSWDADLDVYLIAPDGTRVELFTDVGASGENFSNTILDDEATVPITDGSPPFIGSYQPEGSLSDLDGLSMTGIWTLEVTDDESLISGTLNSWCLIIDTSCPLPPEPTNPNPPDGAENVPLDACLSWNSSSAQASESKAIGRPKVIYGVDDRLDEYQVIDPNILAVGDSTVALVSWNDLRDNHDGTFSLPTETFAYWYQKYYDENPLHRPLCDDERFRDQPNPTWCSGFLVAPDIVATAGHCITDAEDCGDVAFIFGFVMLAPTTPVLTIDASQIYSCSEIIDRQESSDSDWALIRLDRQVPDHVPLSLRRTGRVPDSEDLLVIGHPMGLPRKYAGGATVRDNSAVSYFQANLDTYGGSSGSAVFNANTVQVEGIMVAGNPDFVKDGSCDRSKVCPDTGCPEWENVTRATEFSDLIPLFDVYFGIDANDLGPICLDTAALSCDPGALQACKTYYWQVVVKNACGETSGPIWSFTTASVAADLNHDCAVDFLDLAIFAEQWTHRVK
jgi:subtilisin-like proprotein convertase family protein